MSCHWAQQSIPLYYYGELPPEEEERLEDHLDGCEACRRESERYRAMSAALDRREAPVDPDLLAECRHGLMRAVYHQEAPERRSVHASPWASFREGFASLFGALPRYRQAAGAVALIALGFFSARLTTDRQPVAPPSDVVSSTIRSIQPDDSGQVQIALDETRRRVISGKLEDARIRGLLLAAAREEDNSAVRMESVGILKNLPMRDVRGALVNAALHDPNAAVRLRALEGLKPYAAQPEVRDALSKVLLNDENTGVRIQTIDMLIAHPDDSMVGVLQDLVQKENNSYVRLKCARALREMNASIGTF